MDSLTQIVLGAAVGEAVLGRKIGNKAILYGAIAGTIPDLDVIIAPIGGGGLISGTCIAAKGINPNITIMGAEPKGADDAYLSLAKGEIVPQTNPNTIADGLLSSLGKKTFPIIAEHVSKILTVSEKNIIRAMRLVWERLNIIIEPSSAVVLAALLEHPEENKEKKRAYARE